MDREKLLRSYWTGATDENIADVLFRLDSNGLAFGKDTSVWHEVTLWSRRNDSRVPCPHCGAKMSDKRMAQHELCRLRALKGLPTPKLDDSIRCPCSKCNPNR